MPPSPARRQAVNKTGPPPVHVSSVPMQVGAPLHLALSTAALRSPSKSLPMSPSTTTGAYASPSSKANLSARASGDKTTLTPSTADAGWLLTPSKRQPQGSPIPIRGQSTPSKSPSGTPSRVQTPGLRLANPSLLRSKRTTEMGTDQKQQQSPSSSSSFHSTNTSHDIMTDNRQSITQPRIQRALSFTDALTFHGGPVPSSNTSLPSPTHNSSPLPPLSLDLMVPDSFDFPIQDEIEAPRSKRSPTPSVSPSSTSSARQRPSSSVTPPPTPSSSRSTFLPQGQQDISYRAPSPTITPTKRRDTSSSSSFSPSGISNDTRSPHSKRFLPSTPQRISLSSSPISSTSSSASSSATPVNPFGHPRSHPRLPSNSQQSSLLSKLLDQYITSHLHPSDPLTATLHSLTSRPALNPCSLPGYADLSQDTPGHQSSDENEPSSPILYDTPSKSKSNVATTTTTTTTTTNKSTSSSPFSSPSAALSTLSTADILAHIDQDIVSAILAFPPSSLQSSTLVPPSTHALHPPSSSTSTSSSSPSIPPNLAHNVLIPLIETIRTNQGFPPLLSSRVALSSQRNYFQSSSTASRVVASLGSKSSSSKVTDLPLSESSIHQQMIQKISNEHDASHTLSHLHSLHSQRYPSWNALLRSGWSLLLHGIGSKKDLLTDFASLYLTDGPVIVVNGYCDRLDVKKLIKYISEEVVIRSSKYRKYYYTSDTTDHHHHHHHHHHHQGHLDKEESEVNSHARRTTRQSMLTGGEGHQIKDVNRAKDTLSGTSMESQAGAHKDIYNRHMAGSVHNVSYYYVRPKGGRNDEPRETQGSRRSDEGKSHEGRSRTKQDSDDEEEDTDVVIGRKRKRSVASYSSVKRRKVESVKGKGKNESESETKGAEVHSDTTTTSYNKVDPSFVMVDNDTATSTSTHGAFYITPRPCAPWTSSTVSTLQSNVDPTITVSSKLDSQTVLNIREIANKLMIGASLQSALIERSLPSPKLPEGLLPWNKNQLEDVARKTPSKCSAMRTNSSSLSGSSTPSLPTIPPSPYPPRVYVVIHSLDAPSLRSPFALAALSALTSIFNVYLIASSDTISCQLLFPPAISSNFNFLAIHAPTYKSYIEETTTLPPVLSKMKQESRERDLGHILASLTSNHKSLLNILAKRIQSQEKASQSKSKQQQQSQQNGRRGRAAQLVLGLTEQEWMEDALDEMIVGSADGFRRVLKELLEQDVVRVKINHLGKQVYVLPQGEVERYLA